MDDNTIQFLIGQKITFINSAVNACMLWWVSSYVFYGYVLAAVWSKRAELQGRRLINWIGIILSIFFLSTCVFGVLSICYLSDVKAEIAALARNLKYQDGFFNTELSNFQWAMRIGAGSFFLVWLTWVFMWCQIRKGVSISKEAPNDKTKRRTRSK